MNLLWIVSRFAMELRANPVSIKQNGVVTFVQPTLSLWDEPVSDHTTRILANSSDRVAWLRARSTGVTATDVARLASDRSLSTVADEKLNGRSFAGNAFTDHGNAREPEIARWVQLHHGIQPSSALFHARDERLHLATPDGVGVVNGTVLLAEIKTTSMGWRSIPRSYLRQVWWQQYVLGAERTLFVWEQHEDFVPMHDEPESIWIERDDAEIRTLIGLANQLLRLMKR